LQQRCTVSRLNNESSYSAKPTSGVFEQTLFSSTQIRFIERLSKDGPNVRRLSKKPRPHAACLRGKASRQLRTLSYRSTLFPSKRRYPVEPLQHLHGRQRHLDRPRVVSHNESIATEVIFATCWLVKPSERGPFSTCTMGSSTRVV
jgi:hypothetical protein